MGAVLTVCSRLQDAVLLNNIVQNFGMLDLVKKVLASHKCQMDRSREQYARDLAGTSGGQGLPGPSAPVAVPGHCLVGQLLLREHRRHSLEGGGPGEPSLARLTGKPTRRA